MAYWSPYQSLSSQGGSSTLPKPDTSGLYSGMTPNDPLKAGQAGRTDAQLAQMNQVGPGGSKKSGPGASDWVNAGVGALGGIANAMQTQSTDPLDFSVDPWAGYTGSAEGFASGGVYGAIIGGAVAQLDTFNKVHSSLDKLDTGVQTSQYDAMGKPLYSGQGVLNAQKTVGALKEGEDAINTSFDPATHVISWVRGTGNDLKKAKRAVTTGIQGGQRSYNKQIQERNQQQLALEQYSQMMNKGNRFKSLYNIGNQTLY